MVRCIGVEEHHEENYIHEDKFIKTTNTNFTYEKNSQMSSLDRLRAVEVLLAVVEGGSFSAAAKKLGLTPGAVSKQIANLEEHLGHCLIHRTTRSMSLSAEGEKYLELCQPLLHGFDQADATMMNLKTGALVGRIKISAPIVFGRREVLPLLFDFMERWPDVEVETLFEDRWVDLVEERVDLVVRLARELPDLNLVGKCLGDYPSVLAASTSYINARGPFERIEDLKGCDGLMLRARSSELTWRVGGQLVRPRLKLVMGDLSSLVEAVRRGLGIAAVPKAWIQKELNRGELVELFPGKLELTRKVWLLRKESTYPTQLVDNMASHLEQGLRQELGS